MTRHTPRRLIALPFLVPGSVGSVVLRPVDATFSVPPMRRAKAVAAPYRRCDMRGLGMAKIKALEPQGVIACHDTWPTEQTKTRKCTALTGADRKRE